jgi:hypothetical protein
MDIQFPCGIAKLYTSLANVNMADLRLQVSIDSLFCILQA